MPLKEAVFKHLQ